MCVCVCIFKQRQVAKVIWLATIGSLGISPGVVGNDSWSHPSSHCKHLSWIIMSRRLSNSSEDMDWDSSSAASCIDCLLRPLPNGPDPTFAIVRDNNNTCCSPALLIAFLTSFHDEWVLSGKIKIRNPKWASVYTILNGSDSSSATLFRQCLLNSKKQN